MKSIKFLLFASLLLLINACSSTKKIKTENGISGIRLVTLGGLKQWVLIRGEDKLNPVVLFLHGGPGASETALLRKFNGDLEKDFTMVYWDQRGATKSYSKDIPAETMTLDQFVEDAHQLVTYLKKELSVQKIVLVGHSWGTVLGMELVNKYPEDFICYVGIGQVVNTAMAESLSYNYTLNKAKEANNKKAVKELEAMGEPVNGKYSPWDLGKQRKWLLKFGGERYAKHHYRDWAFDILASREYTIFDLFRFMKGSAFSWALRDDEEQVDFFTQIPAVQIPVFFCAGKYDMNTPEALVKQYYTSLNAPAKKFTEFDRSGHSPPFEVPDAFNAFMVEDILPLAKLQK